MLYAESSAVLAWLLGESTAHTVAGELDSAAQILTSELTLLEVERVLLRAEVTSSLQELDVHRARDKVRTVSAYWMVARLHAPALERAGRAFPLEPLRTLDALHLATALDARRAGPPITVLSLDRRIRENAVALGLRVRPD